MLYTVTLNPAIDYVIQMDTLCHGGRVFGRIFKDAKLQLCTAIGGCRRQCYRISCRLSNGNRYLSLAQRAIMMYNEENHVR